MIKKLFISVLAIVISLGLVGCVNDEPECGKVINNSITIQAKVISYTKSGGRYGNSYLDLKTDKGDYCVYKIDYYQQVLDLYNLKNANNKDFIIDIVYDNTSKGNLLENAYNVIQVIPVE